MLVVRQFSAVRTPLLLRDFIENRLYDESSGYFAQHVKIGGPENRGLQDPIEFNKLFDEYDFKLELKSRYKEGMSAMQDQQMCDVQCTRVWCMDDSSGGVSSMVWIRNCGLHFKDCDK